MFATLPRLVVSLPSLFTMRPPVSLNSASVFHIVVCIVLGISKPGFGEDGHLFCRKKWIDGVSVTLTCEVDKGSIETKCFEQQNSTIFNRDGSPQCEVGAAGYADCPLVTDSTNPSAACWCEQNETYYIFKYRLKANRLEDDGLWTCQKGCFDNSLVVNPLNITADTSCHASVEESACTSMTCAGPGVCKLNTTTNEGQCVCPHERLKADCGQCRTLDLRSGCRKWDGAVLITISLILCLLLIGLLVYFFAYQKTSNHPVQHNHKTEEQLKNFIEKLRSACDQIMKEMGGYPKIVIEVTQSRLEDPSYVIISGKNYFVLSEAKKKVLGKMEELKKQQ